MQDDSQEKHGNGCDDEGYFCKIGGEHGKENSAQVIRNGRSEKAILVDPSPWDTKEVLVWAALCHL